MASGHLTCWFWKFSIILHSMHMKHFFSELMLFSFRSIRSSLDRHDIGKEGSLILIWKESLQCPKYLLDIL